MEKWIAGRHSSVEITHDGEGFSLILPFKNPVGKDFKLTTQGWTGMFALVRRVVPASRFKMQDKNAERSFSIRNRYIQTAA